MSLMLKLRDLPSMRPPHHAGEMPALGGPQYAYSHWLNRERRNIAGRPAFVHRCPCARKAS